MFTLNKSVSSIGWTYPFCGGANGLFEQFTGARLGRTQPGFEFTEGEFNGIKVGRIERWLRQAQALGYGYLVQTGDLVHSLVVSTTTSTGRKADPST